MPVDVFGIQPFIVDRENGRPHLGQNTREDGSIIRTLAASIQFE